MGATPEEAVHLYRQIWYYTAGEILIRVRRERRLDEAESPTYREKAFARLDPGIHPRLAALSERWSDLTAEDTYVDGLRALVDGALQRSGD
jgi:hypothetical protein